MNHFVKLLSGGDLHSNGSSDEAVLKVWNEDDFEALFKCMSFTDRVVRMRAAAAIEKITQKHPSYLFKHKTGLMDLCCRTMDKELKGYLALLISRIDFKDKEKEIVWQRLSGWASDSEESRMVRINSIHSLHQIAEDDHFYLNDFELITDQIEKENIPFLDIPIDKLIPQVTV